MSDDIDYLMLAPNLGNRSPDKQVFLLSFFGFLVPPSFYTLGN